MKKLLSSLALSACIPFLCSGQSFSNPLQPRVADSFVAKFGDYYYLVGTPCPGNWEIQWAGVWKSRDMVNWSGPYLAYEGERRDVPMWASEIYHKGDGYYMITTCNTWNAGATMMVQKAPTPLGPYTLHAHLPKHGLDPGIFTDTDGKSYMLHSSWITPLDSLWKTVTGEHLGVAGNTEGHFIIKNNNRYLRFFSRIIPGYPMEYEISSEPYVSEYEGKGVVYSGVCDPGHGSIVASPDGTELWIVSHYNTGGWETRRLAMDRIRFDAGGLPVPVLRDTSAQMAPSLCRRGQDMAPGKFVNSSALIAGNDPLKATDGDLQTAWKTEEYLEIDLAGEFKVAKVGLDFPDGGEYSWTVLSSTDRINWKEGFAGFSRYLRIVDCTAPSIAEIHVYPVPETIPVWSSCESCDTALHHLERGTRERLGLRVRRSGDYDIVYRLKALDGLHNSWSLYAGDEKVAAESVATTGTDDNVTQVISFKVRLEEGTADFSLVGEEGSVDIVEVALELLEAPRTYTNPVWNGNAPDPTVIHASDGKYYAFATQGSAPDGSRCRIQVLSSSDLVSWEHLGDALPEPPEWARTTFNFWAPHVIEAKGRYYMYYSAEPDPVFKTGKELGLCLAVAVSDRPEGPYRDSGKPLLSGDSFINIDPMAFHDPVSGRYYLYWGSGFEPIKVRELSDDLTGFRKRSKAKELVYPFHQGYQFLVEGAWVVFKDGWYYLFFSGDNCCGEKAHYAVMVARSKSPEGPFEVRKDKEEGDSPILQAGGRWIAPGHNSILEDAEGAMWIFYHAMDRDDRYQDPENHAGDIRRMLMDRLSFRDGWPVIDGGVPSDTVMPAPALEKEPVRQGCSQAGHAAPVSSDP